MTRIETAVILATELVLATPLARQAGNVRFEELRRDHDALLAGDIEDHGGRVIKHTGDGVLASFPSVTAAIAAGAVIQQHLERRRHAADIATGIRIGISVGDAAVDEGDYFGIAPIEATRLCAKAGGGEILVADPARAMVRADHSHRFEAVPPLELKGLPEPVTAWRVVWDPEALARSTLARGGFGLDLGVDETLVASAREAISGLAPETSPGLLAQLKGLLGVALHFAPAPAAESRHRLCAEAVALARSEHERSGAREDAAALAYVLGRSLLADWGPDSADGDVECAELLELCRRLGDHEIELLARVWRISVRFERGDLTAAARELARVERMADELDPPRALVELPLGRAMALILGGRLSAAERLRDAHVRRAAEIGVARSSWPATAQLLALRLLQGRLPEFEDQLRALTRAHPSMAVLRAALATSLVQAGRDTEARALLEAALAGGLGGVPLDSTRIATLALLADAATRLGDRKRARWLYDALAPYRGRWVVLPAAAVLWPVDRSLGQAAGAAGALDAAFAHLAAARTLGGRADAVPTLALVALDEARLLAGRGGPGDPERVRTRSREARTLAEAVGMHGVAADAATLDSGSAEPIPAAG